MSDSAAPWLWAAGCDLKTLVDAVDADWAADSVPFDDVTARLQASLDDPEDPAAAGDLEALRALEDQLMWRDMGFRRMT